jgi:hypothetical protein
MNRRTFYRSGAELLSGNEQRLGALRRDVREPCPGAGCPLYENGWSIEVNLADAQDANVARFIREGKTGRRYEEVLLMENVMQFRFYADQPCLGHKIAWRDPVYLVGQRKATESEYKDRLGEGVEAINYGRTRGI